MARLPSIGDLTTAVAAIAAELPNTVLGVLLIGSLAREEANASSDVDLLVLVGDRLRTPQKLLREKLIGVLQDQGIDLDEELLDLQVVGQHDLEGVEARRAFSLRVRVRAFDVGNGSRLLWGTDFGRQFQDLAPAGDAVAHAIIEALDTGGTTAAGQDPRSPDRECLHDVAAQVIFVEMGRRYLETGVWPAKLQAVEAATDELVRAAWNLRTRPDDVIGSSALLSRQAWRRYRLKVAGALPAIRT
jgi:predicted nucleotidyltransferase